MVGEGIVVVPVNLLRVQIHLLTEQGEQGQHIGLLDDTVMLGALDPEKGLVGGPTPLIAVLIKRLQLKKTSNCSNFPMGISSKTP